MKSVLSHTLAVLLLFVTAFTASAQSQDATEAIRLTVGEVLEITTDASSPTATFNWILTKDRSFQSAARTRFFQSRLTEPGTYVLDVSTQDATTGTSGYRAFTITVSEGQTPALPQRNPDEPPQAVLRTDRTAANEAIGLPENGGLVKIDPSLSRGRIDQFALDLDSTIDTNGDGDPRNDQDAAGTSFEKIGSPVYVYMLPRQGRQLTLTASNTRGDLESRTSLDVLFGVTVGQNTSGSVQQTGPISVQNENGKLTFSVTLDPSTVGDRELLYEWDFGDRRRSLLSRPTHQYAAAGTYGVSLRIRDIQTGEVVFSTSQNIVVDASAVGGTASSQASSVASEPSDPETGGSAFSLWNILKVLFIVVILLGMALGLYALLMWLKGKTTNGLQKTLEKMEETIIEKDPKDPSATAKPEPLKVTKPTSPTPAPAKILSMEEVSDQEKTHTDFKKTIEKAPMTATGPVPSWLQSSERTPPPPAEQKSASPNPPEKKQDARPANGTNGDGPVPSWLKAPAESAPKPVAPAQAKPTEPKNTAPHPTAPPNPPKPQTPPPPKTATPTAPAPSSVPKPSTEPVPTAPTETAPPQPHPPKPVNEPKKAPPPTPKPIPKQENKKNSNDDDPPIAIISADSLKK